MPESLTCGKKPQLNYRPKSPPINRGLEYCQQNLFTPSGPAVTLEPLSNRPGRVRLTIRQEDCTWGLVPHLSRSEGERLLEFLQTAGIEFDLDLNEGHPLDADIINSAVESLIDSGLVREVAA